MELWYFLTTECSVLESEVPLNSVPLLKWYIVAQKKYQSRGDHWAFR